VRPEPHQVAARLGFDATTIRRLEACGYLSRLALTDAELRERLYHAHLAIYPQHLAGRKEPGERA
jgi:hypothetical protein